MAAEPKHLLELQKAELGELKKQEERLSNDDTL